MTWIDVAPYCAVAIALLMLLTWAVSVVVSDASLVDRVWGLGFSLTAVVAWFAAHRPVAFGPIAVMVCAVIWGVRLSAYLWWRNSGSGEDFRYQAMRRHHGKKFPLISLLTVFGVQAALMFVVSLPLQVAPLLTTAPAWIVVVGVVIWCIGFGFEAIGDAQLTRFKADPNNAGTVMNQGLWAWTRHPNYFGDATLWWGMYIAGGLWGRWWWSAIGSLIMTILVRRVSGVTLLEKSLKKRRAGYEEYIASTPAFFPRPPRRRETSTRA